MTASADRPDRPWRPTQFRVSGVYKRTQQVWVTDRRTGDRVRRKVARFDVRYRVDGHQFSYTFEQRGWADSFARRLHEAFAEGGQRRRRPPGQRHRPGAVRLDRRGLRGRRSRRGGRFPRLRVTPPGSTPGPATSSPASSRSYRSGDGHGNDNRITHRGSLRPPPGGRLHHHHDRAGAGDHDRPALIGQPSEVGALVMTYGLLLGGSVLTARRAGPGGIRLLFSGLLRWRIGWANAAVVLARVPLATIGVAAVTGTYVAPDGGWLPVIGSYLFTTFVFGALLLNLWEETGWQGMVQRHFMGRHGLVKGCLLTAVPFAIVHIPLQLRGTSGLREALINVGVLFLMAPAARYLVGRTDYATGGCLLAVGVLHASWNASGQLSVVDGDLPVRHRPRHRGHHGPGRRHGPGPVQLRRAVDQRGRRPASTAAAS